MNAAKSKKERLAAAVKPDSKELFARYCSQKRLPWTGGEIDWYTMWLQRILRDEFAPGADMSNLKVKKAPRKKVVIKDTKPRDG